MRTSVTPPTAPRVGDINVDLFTKDVLAAAGAGPASVRQRCPEQTSILQDTHPFPLFLGLSSQILLIFGRRAWPAGRGQGTEGSMYSLAFCPHCLSSRGEAIDPFCRWGSGGLQGTGISPRSCSPEELALGVGPIGLPDSDLSPLSIHQASPASILPKPWLEIKVFHCLPHLLCGHKQSGAFVRCGN